MVELTNHVAISLNRLHPQVDAVGRRSRAKHLSVEGHRIFVHRLPQGQDIAARLCQVYLPQGVLDLLMLLAW